MKSVNQKLCWEAHESFCIKLEFECRKHVDTNQTTYKVTNRTNNVPSIVIKVNIIQLRNFNEIQIMKETGTQTVQTQAFVEIGALDGIQVDVYIIGSVCKRFGSC